MALDHLTLGSLPSSSNLMWILHGEFVTWEEPEGFTSEPVFVRTPDGKAEDDGVILSCVINVKDQTTSLLILDAKEFKELGRAVVQEVTSATLHGIFH